MTISVNIISHCYEQIMFSDLFYFPCRILFYIFGEEKGYNPDEIEYCNT